MKANDVVLGHFQKIIGREKYSLLAPHILIMLARLQLFGRIAIKAPEYILQVISAVAELTRLCGGDPAPFHKRLNEL